MRRLVRDHKIKTVVALAHPPDHPLVVREQALARELGVRWVHVPIVDQRSIGDKQTISDRLEEAAAILADPTNQPVYFHCHHGINRASMVQIAYRTKHCGWTLEQATDEIARTFGLVEVSHGPDYRHMQSFYNERVLPVPPERGRTHHGGQGEPPTADPVLISLPGVGMGREGGWAAAVLASTTKSAGEREG